MELISTDIQNKRQIKQDIAYLERPSARQWRADPRRMTGGGKKTTAAVALLPSETVCCVIQSFRSDHGAEHSHMGLVDFILKSTTTAAALTSPPLTPGCGFNLRTDRTQCKVNPHRVLCSPEGDLDQQTLATGSKANISVRRSATAAHERSLAVHVIDYFGILFYLQMNTSIAMSARRAAVREKNRKCWSWFMGTHPVISLSSL